jgi:LPXTG-motif cell wall-anchored protein
MFLRSNLLLSLPLLFTASLFAASDADTQNVSFDKPVQIPEAVLQPGKYKIQLEDHLADRAIVRITEPSGTDHYLLTVPSKKLSASSKGLIFFAAPTDTEVLHGWECAGCKRPLEFVYPKDEAVKLTASTGKPILAYDSSYDKLPDNLSAEDRKVVTLWLLSPKTVTAEGKGEGLTAAKFSSPRLTASAEALPKKLPKTSSNGFSEVALGLVSLLLAAALFLRRKMESVSH